jgi:hypothetical protein
MRAPEHADGSTDGVVGLAIAAVLPSSVVNSTSNAFPSAYT